MKLVAAIDLGTTGVKVTIFDGDLNPLCSASSEQELIFPSPGHIEQDPAAWYEVPMALLGRAAEQGGVDPSLIAAVGISSQGISILPVDDSFMPLARGISWLDMRAGEQLGRLNRALSAEKVFEITGKHSSPAYSLPKIMWLKEDRPEIYDAARYLLMPMDYLVARMTGAAVTDPTMAGGTMLYDISAREWSGELARAAGVDAGKLARVLPSGAFAGRVGAQAARLSGLPEGAIVAVGAQDQKAAAYGAGLTPGSATLSLGTAAAIEVISRGRSDLLPAFPYVDGERMVLEGCINTAGAAIKWARETIMGGAEYDEINALAAASPPGANGVIFRPHLSGSGTAHPSDNIEGGFEGLSLSSGRADMMRAVYEGLAYEIKLNVLAARRAGAAISELNAFGGAARSGIFMDIIAGVCGAPVRALDWPEMGLLGAAMLAAPHAGINVEAARSARSATVHVPVSEREYARLFEKYAGVQD